MRATEFILAAAIAMLACSTSRGDLTLDNGALTVVIRSDNGAIGQVLFGGSDYYNPGIPVANWGLQNGSDPSSLVLNTTSGGVGQAVSVMDAGGEVVVIGTYAEGSATLEFTRTYSLVPGWDVLRIRTSFVNTGPALLLSYFDTLDPDQGYDQGHGFGTYNDVFGLSTGLGPALVAQATAPGGLSVIMGSLDSQAAVASGDPLQISDSQRLSSFFVSPCDGDGAYADAGTHVGWLTLLGPGTSRTFVYDQAYGPTAAEAREQFRGANVPTPASVGMAILGLGAFGWLRHRQARP